MPRLIATVFADPRIDTANKLHALTDIPMLC